MILDKETNFIYLSDRLANKCPNVYKQLSYWFNKLKINYSILPNTNDLWVVDFMPLQIGEHNYLQFKFDPDYLKPQKYHALKTDPQVICANIGLTPVRTDIIIDGGNIVKGKNKAIATTKILRENPGYSETDLIKEITNKLGIAQLIVIPQEPGDFIGHADGMVRFADDNKVIVSEYPKNKIYEDFSYALRSALRNAGLDCIEFPYDSWQNKDASDATGCYVNFLETGQYVFYPMFDAPNDQIALKRLQYAFPERNLIGIDCQELSKFGGVLNCITWNILKAGNQNKQLIES